MSCSVCLDVIMEVEALVLSLNNLEWFPPLRYENDDSIAGACSAQMVKTFAYPVSKLLRAYQSIGRYGIVYGHPRRVASDGNLERQPEGCREAGKVVQIVAFALLGASNLLQTSEEAFEPC